MKLTFSALFLSFSLLTFSQESQTGLVRIEVTAGLYSTKDIHTAINFSEADAWGKHSAANYFIDTYFYRYKKIEIGLGLGYQKPHPKEYQSLGPQGQSVLVDDPGVDLQYFTVMPEIRFNWVRSEDDFLELYSNIGLGLTIVDAKYNTTSQYPPDETYPLPSIHVTWLGMRFGDKLGGFVEFGLGTKGLLAGGLSYRL